MGHVTPLQFTSLQYNPIHFYPALFTCYVKPLQKWLTSLCVLKGRVAKDVDVYTFGIMYEQELFFGTYNDKKKSISLNLL